ncbi:MAG: hypothetical protein ABII10_01820, partial [Candidatus Paceibacterota bacterium]
MVEKFPTLGEAVEKHKEHFSLEDIRLLLESSGQEERLLNLLEGAEQHAIDDNGEITPAGKDSGLANLVVEISRVALEKFASIEAKITLAKIKGEEINTLKIEGAKEGASLENLFSALISFNGVIYGYLNKYGEAGLLSPEEMKRLGFSKRDIEVIEKNLAAKIAEELQTWEKGDAIKTILSLVDLENEIKKDVPNTGDEIDFAIETLRSQLEKTKNELKIKKIVGDKYDFVQKEYLDLAEKKIDDLKQKKSEILDAEQKNEKNERNRLAIEEFEKQVEPYKDAIKSIPKTRSELGLDGAGEKRFEDQELELEKLRTNLMLQKQLLNETTIFKKRQEDSPGASEINNTIDFLTGTQYDTAKQRIDRLIKEAQEPPIEEMEIEDLAYTILKERKDPFFWKEWKAAAGLSQRLQDVVNEFIRKAGKRKEDEPEEEIKRIVQKVRVQLGTLSNELQHENEKASRDRSRLFAEMAKRVITRRELLIATTYNPDWGDDIREMLQWAFRTAALDGGEIAIEDDDGKLFKTKLDPDQITFLKKLNKKSDRFIERTIGTDGEGRDIRRVEIETLVGPIEEGEVDLTSRVRARHIRNMGYNDLAGESGVTNLANGLRKEFPQWHKKPGEEGYNPDQELVMWFVQELFVAFDLLTISLQEFQKNTRTRSHNGGIQDKDRIMLG